MVPCQGVRPLRPLPTPTNSDNQYRRLLGVPTDHIVAVAGCRRKNSRALCEQNDCLCAHLAAGDVLPDREHAISSEAEECGQRGQNLLFLFESCPRYRLRIKDLQRCESFFVAFLRPAVQYFVQCDNSNDPRKHNQTRTRPQEGKEKMAGLIKRGDTYYALYRVKS